MRRSELRNIVLGFRYTKGRIYIFDMGVKAAYIEFGLLRTHPIYANNVYKWIFVNFIVHTYIYFYILTISY